jgi:hypothetical protein
LVKDFSKKKKKLVKDKLCPVGLKINIIASRPFFFLQLFSLFHIFIYELIHPPRPKWSAIKCHDESNSVLTLA